MNLRKMRAYKFCKRWGLSFTFVIFLVLQLFILNETRHSNEQLQSVISHHCVHLVQAKEEMKDVVYLIVSAFGDEKLADQIDHEMDSIFIELEC